jgi:hypothetical protein
LGAYEQDITLPELACVKASNEEKASELIRVKASNEEKALVQSTLNLEEFWRTSCYHLEENAPRKSTMALNFSWLTFLYLLHLLILCNGNAPYTPIYGLAACLLALKLLARQSFM